MRVARLFIRGQYEDVQLYMGHLLLWTTEGTVRVFSLSSVAALVDQMVPSQPPLGELLFARNDLLEPSRRTSPLRDKSVRRAFLEQLADFPGDLEMDERRLDGQEFELSVKAQVLLDTTVYNGRIYMAADTGLFDVDAVWEQGAFEWGATRKRLDARCVSALAKFGSISASCEQEGLFASFDDFGLIRSDPPRKMRKVADKSVRVGWWRTSLLNYQTSVLADLFDTVREPVPSGAKFREPERTVVISAKLDRPLAVLLDLLESKLDIQSRDILWVGNSNKYFFVCTSDGRLLIVGLVVRSDGTIDLGWTKTFDAFRDRVVGSYPSEAGLVLEGDYKTWLFADGEFIPLFDGDAIAVRTFMNSRWYKRLAAVVSDQGLLLNAFITDGEHDEARAARS